MLLYTTIDIKMQAKLYSPGILAVLTVDIISITSMSFILFDSQKGEGDG